MRKNMRVIQVAAAACLLGIAMAPGAVQAQQNGSALPRIDASRVNPQPLYPDAAQMRGEQGSVDLSVYVTSSGRAMGRLKIVKSSGFADLDNSAVEAVLGWHYVPAADSDGDTQSAWMPVHIEFKLPQPPQPTPPAPQNNAPA